MELTRAESADQGMTAVDAIGAIGGGLAISGFFLAFGFVLAVPTSVAGYAIGRLAFRPEGE